MAHDSVGTKNQPQYTSAGVPATAADLSEISNWAAYNGNRKADTSTIRTGLTGADVWAGLEFYETDTRLKYTYTGTSWVLSGGLSVASTFTPTGIYSAGASAPTLTKFGGRVTLEGNVVSSSASFVLGTTYTIGSIPSADAPARTMSWSCPTNITAVALVTVTSTGSVTIVINQTFGPAALNLLLNCTWLQKGI